jgi:hypothetical protein
VALTRFGPDAAGTWREATLSPTARWVVLGVGVVGLVAGLAGAPEAQCTALDPCTANDLDSFGVFLGLLALSLLGLWLWPAAGGALGIAAAVVDIVYDPSIPARWVYAAYAVGCLQLLLGLRRSRRAQRAVLGEVPKQTVVASHVPVMASGRQVWAPGLWLGAGAAVVVALLAFGAFAGAKSSDAEHRERAVKATGTVVSGWDDDLSQRVSVDRAGLPEHVLVSASWELPRGTEVQLLVDPSDPTWVELPNDPHDHSGWLALGIIGLGVAVGALGLIGTRRWIASHHLTEGVAVEVSVSPSGQARLRPVGGGESFAAFLTGSPSHTPGGGRLRRRIDWVPAVVVGDLRDRGWVKVFTDTGVIIPATPVRAIRWEGGKLGLPVAPGRGSSFGRRLESVAVWAPWREVGLVVVGLLIAVTSMTMLPDAITVAEGGGVPGTLTITTEDCGKSCSYSGDFRSQDGTYVFRDVYFARSGEIGSTWPAVYVGSGEQPEEVYEPGNSALRTSGFFSLAGLGAAAYPFVRGFLDSPSGPKKPRR